MPMTPTVNYLFTYSFSSADYVEAVTTMPAVGKKWTERHGINGSTTYYVYTSDTAQKIAEYCLLSKDTMEEPGNGDISHWKYLAFLLKKIAREDRASSFYEVNTKSLLFQFKTLDVIYWSMLLYEQEWISNGLKDFREAFIDHIAQSTLLNQTLNGNDWLLSMVTAYYNQFNSLNNTYYSPEMTMLIAVILGAIALTLIIVLSGLSEDIAIFVGCVSFVGSISFGAMVRFIQKEDYAEEDEKFSIFCKKSNELLNGREINNIPEGVASQNATEYLHSKRQENSFSSKCFSLFYNKAPRPEINPVNSPTP